MSDTSMPENRRCIQTDDAPPPIGPYCQGNIAGPFVFTAAVGGADPRSGEIPPGITQQTERALRSLDAILRAGGCRLSDVTKVTAFLSTLDDFDAMNRVYAARFRQPYPARSILQTTLPGRGARVAFDAVALRPTDV